MSDEVEEGAQTVAATSSDPQPDETQQDSGLLGDASPLKVRDRARYTVVGEHGRGGLGVVSRAFDTELGRHIAIKEMQRRGDVGEQRFLREALITARLEHPASSRSTRPVAGPMARRST